MKKQSELRDDKMDIQDLLFKTKLITNVFKRAFPYWISLLAAIFTGLVYFHPDTVFVAAVFFFYLFSIGLFFFYRTGE